MKHLELKNIVMFKVRRKEIELFVEEHAGSHDRNTWEAIDTSIFVATFIIVVIGDERDHKGNNDSEIVGLSTYRVEPGEAIVCLIKSEHHNESKETV
jgi:hypothetical protein